MTRIRSIHPYNFRNLANQKTVLDFSQVLFVGPNGQGKTNFLESIYFLCLAGSFRTRAEEDIRTLGSENFAVNGEVYYHEEKSKISILCERQKKKIQLGNKIVRDRKDLLSILPCVVFIHNDIEFINGNPEKRRTYLDQTLSLIDPLYIADYRRFRQILKNRNKILKEQETQLLSAVDEEFASAGLLIQQSRMKIVSHISDIFSDLFRSISGITDAEIRIEYSPSWKEENKESVLAAIRKKHQHELIIGSSLSGPQRDRIRFLYGKNDFRSIASTGQLRLASLILRCVQALLCSRQRENAPILLLDDVLLELDSACRQRFLQNLPPASQSFFTFLPDEKYRYFDNPDVCFYNVHKGEAHSS